MAIVTGGSRGIGAAIAQRLARDGASVVVGFVNAADHAGRVVQAIAAGGGAATACRCDLSQPLDASRLVTHALERFGRLDILVNNAGIVENCRLSHIDADHVSRLLAVNVTGLLLMTQAAAEHMQPGSCIVNVSSTAAAGASVDRPVYAATKAAVDSLTRSLAADLGRRGIRVVGVAPGMITTETTMRIMAEAARRAATEATALGRLGTPEEVARAVALVVSDDASWITGATIALHGGIRLEGGSLGPVPR